jgi:radical SAM superfamily enzyme YgiQ (UPF0313 family)
VKPLKVTLIHSWDGEDRNQYFISPPLGVHRIAKWAGTKLGADIDIEVIDPNLFEPADALDVVTENLWLRQPDVIGFSPLHLTLENDIAMMLTSAGVCQNAFFLAGGRQATTDPDTLFSEFESLHTIVKGEAELIFVEVLQSLIRYGVHAVNNNPAYLADISGLLVRGRNKTIRDTGPNPGLSPRDFLAATRLMDFSDMDVEKYWDILRGQYSKKQLASTDLLSKIFTLKPITTNFCPMNCSFCDVTSKQRKEIGSDIHVTGLRGKHLEDYVTTLLEIHPQVRQILFKDDLWFLRGKGAIRGTKSSPLLYDDLKALQRVRDRFSNRNIVFSGKARVDTFVDPSTLQVDWPLLKATREAGFVSISMGIESFDYDDLIYFNKRLGINGPEVNKLAIRSIEQAGISSVSYLILSNNNSTVSSILKNADSIIELLEESPKHVIKLNDFLFPLPGTDITDAFNRDATNIVSETKRFPVPRFPGKFVERIVKIYPNDPVARQLMVEYEHTKKRAEQDAKNELNIQHWISEYSTPTNIRLLYGIASKQKLIERSYALTQNQRLTRILETFRREQVEYTSATLTDA